MHFFFAPNLYTVDFLNAEESSHCTKVLRLKSGEIICIVDGKGTLCKAKLMETHPNKCHFKIIDMYKTYKQRQYDIHIAIAPPKNMKRMEWFVEKCTEIGIDKITPLNCQQSEKKHIKIERLMKTAIAAMKQSRQAYLPTINVLSDFTTFIKANPEKQKFIAHCHGNNRKWLSSFYQKSHNVVVLIGPEGDFTISEIEQAKMVGFQSILLGTNTLRTETAALVACHTIHVLNSF